MSRSRSNAHQCLPEIAALQHVDEGGGRILEAVGDVLAIADAPFGNRRPDGAGTAPTRGPAATPGRVV